MNAIIDAAVWAVCALMMVRELYTLNSMMLLTSFRWFGIPVFGVVFTSGYILFHGSYNKEFSYPALAFMLAVTRLFDGRLVQRNRKNENAAGKT